MIFFFLIEFKEESLTVGPGREVGFEGVWVLQLSHF